MKTFEVESKVWPVSQGEGVVVAVIDSGVNSDHQDLTGQVVPGADFSGTQSDGRIDTVGHGTGMASLIVGHGHGSQAGVMGLAPKAKILPVKVKTTDGGPEPQVNDLAEAIRFAVDHGATVVNMSLGGLLRFDTKTRKAVAYAVSKDAVLIASAGNSGSDLGVNYPAAFPGVVAVGAVDSKGVVWGGSTPGPETTLIAPGVDIYHASAKSPTSYAAGDGTSGAAAYASATAALIRSKYPSLSAGQVINRMIKSATPPADGSGVPNSRYGYGVLSPAKALEANPAVDNGPRENPLANRPEAKGTPPPVDEETDEPSEAPMVPEGDHGGGSDAIGPWVIVGIGVGLLGLLVGVVVFVVVFVVRGRRRRAAAAGAHQQQPYRQPPYGGPYQ
ncbi:type VII secretion-associated serine protease mycosin [Streptomyces sp. CBMA156]|uniref:type VII secretion-associated serine protease mycosin n=1 Tax=Streptomyces sp. CBMA156 TaxID=1930280 RepID=UPI001661D2B4|nr:type VII secretion-associated serine protease mycosin [Streptomyces sp. CBMA156]